MHRHLAPADKRLIAQLSAVAALSLIIVYLGGRYAESVFLRAESEAASVRMASFLRANLLDLDHILRGDPITEADRVLFQHAARMGGVFRYKLFNADGQIVYASRPDDIGKQVREHYFDDVIRQGESYFKISYRPIGTTAYTDELGTPYEKGVVLVSERYVPIVDDGHFKGALEVYIDMTPLMTRLRRVALAALTGVLLLLISVGSVCGVFIYRNISERKRAEARLRLAASVFDNTTEGIMITDPNGQLQSVNPAFTAITGYRAEEVIGKNPRVLQSGKQSKEFYERMWASILSTGHWQGEIYNRRKNGEIYPHLLNISAIKDYSGRTTNYVGVTCDISELKASERMKDEFIATVSHELRTPLSSIHGSLGLIAGGAAGRISAQAKNLAQIAYNNSERLVRLINDILDLAKMEADNMRFHLRPLDINSLVMQTVAANQAFAKQYEVELLIEQTLPGAKVVGDSDRLIQALTNLLSNAIKYSPPRSQVSLSVSRDAEMVRVAITDHGPGISEKFRDKVFKKFAQADASDMRKKGGTGLGLSISKLIIDRLGGHIDFRSDPGVTTTFYFELPELHKKVRQRTKLGAQVAYHTDE